MSKFRENRELILNAYQSDIINDEEFILFYDLKSSKNCDFPYWKYREFDLDTMSDDECKSDIRFFRNDIYALADLLGLPDGAFSSNDLSTHAGTLTCALDLADPFQSFALFQMK